MKRSRPVSVGPCNVMWPWEVANRAGRCRILKAGSRGPRKRLLSVPLVDGPMARAAERASRKPRHIEAKGMTCDSCQQDDHR